MPPKVTRLLLLLLVLSLAACASAAPAAAPVTQLTFTYWGSDMERAAVDTQGRRPGEAGFDAVRIVTYGAAFDKIYEGWTFYPFIYSNGGEVDEAGRRLLLDRPEAVEAVQALADLMWVHHVAPTPQGDANLPGYVTMLQTGNLAMHITGQWSLLDYAAVTDLRFGVAVLPKFKQPATVVLGSPTVIFAGTSHREAAIRFYKFHNNPEVVDPFARGLWMPLQRAYYIDPDKKQLWLDNPAHPVEMWPAFTDYVVNYSRPLPSYYLRNYAAVLDAAIRPALERIWANRATAAETLAEAVQAAEPLMQGRWDR